MQIALFDCVGHFIGRNVDENDCIQLKIVKTNKKCKIEKVKLTYPYFSTSARVTFYKNLPSCEVCWQHIVSMCLLKRNP